MSEYASIAIKRGLTLAILVMPSLFATGTAIAAGSKTNTGAQLTYRNDRAACMSGQSNQDRATCLKEAGAALQAARRGRLDNGPEGEAQFARNRVLRCDRQPAQDREDCLRRMHGEGVTSGSVESGGILRELVTPQKTEAAPSRRPASRTVLCFSARTLGPPARTLAGTKIPSE